MHENAFYVALEASRPHASVRERNTVCRALDALDEADWVVAPREDAVVLRDAGENPSLPVPRLQLRWSDLGNCHYELVMELGVHDIRREIGGKRSRFMAVPLGRTTLSGMGPIEADGTVRVVYRDGMHIRWDAYRMGLPAFAVYGERSTPIPSQEPPP